MTFCGKKRKKRRKKNGIGKKINKKEKNLRKRRSIR